MKRTRNVLIALVACGLTSTALTQEPKATVPLPPAQTESMQPQESTRIPEANQDGKWGWSILPWGIAVTLAITSGALAAYLVVLKKQDRHFQGLRQRVLDGAAPVSMLPDEALRMLTEIGNEVKSRATEFESQVKRHRDDVSGVIAEAKQSAERSREQTHQVVEGFKHALNTQFEKIGGFMQRISVAAEDSHSAAKDTNEQARQIAELLKAKEEEIKGLRQGYQQSLIGPLIRSFIQIRDEIHALGSGLSDPEVRNHLLDIDRSIELALSEIGVEEIKVAENPTETPVHYWKALPATKPTEDSALHGLLAEIKTRGYAIRSTDGAGNVLRQAVVLRYGTIHEKARAGADLEQKLPNDVN